MLTVTAVAVVVVLVVVLVAEVKPASGAIKAVVEVIVPIQVISMNEYHTRKIKTENVKATAPSSFWQ